MIVLNKTLSLLLFFLLLLLLGVLQDIDTFETLCHLLRGDI